MAEKTGTSARGDQLPAGIIASPAEQQQAATEWQTEDFLAAEPLPIPEITTEMLQAYVEEQANSASKGGQHSAGGEPGAPQDGNGDGRDQPTGYAYPPPFNQHEVLVPYTTYPYCTVGKVFFKQNGGSYVASAASIGNNAIWTAGHVVHVGNNQASGWSTNMVFVPAYKDGAAPFGQWSVTRLLTRTLWYQKGNPGGFCEDMGAGVCAPLSGRKISQAVGWLGFAWNYPRNQVWTLLGYPAAPPFNGMRMWQDTAAYANDGNVPCTPPPVGVGCSLTGGCSGGPWVLGLGSTNYVNGNNSYRPNDQPLELYSPYFGDDAKDLKNAVIAL